MGWFPCFLTFSRTMRALRLPCFIFIFLSFRIGKQYLQLFPVSCSPSSSHRRETLLCAGLLLNRTSHPVFCRRKATAIPGSLETLLHICPVLRPRMDFGARPFRHLIAAPATRTTKAPPTYPISWLNRTAFVLTVYASCRHY